MSYDAILARSPSIIYRPGGVAGGLVVTTWAQVQKFIAAREGAVTVFVDDSIISPALVPGATGVTEGFGRLILDVYAGDSDAFSVLQIEDGATISNLSLLNVLELRCNTQSATPSLSWNATPNGGYLRVTGIAKLSNAATATQSSVVIPAGKDLFLDMYDSFLSMHNPAVPFFSVSVGSTLEFNSYHSVVPPQFASGPGNVELVYDNVTATSFSPTGVVPMLPGITGTYTFENVDDIFPNPGPWSQATWFIDPANSTGLANDLNSGADITHPVLTYNFGVAQKWTTYSPMLRQDTTLTWLSSQPAGNGDPVIFTPIMVGVTATITAPLGAAQQIGAGVLAGVVPKNRGTQQLLEADLGFAAPIGSLVQNTTAGKSSYAWVYLNVAGTVFALTQPLAPAALPVLDGMVPVEVDTWANGDSFVVFAPIEVNIVEVDPTVAEYILPDFTAPVQINHVHLTSANGPFNSEAFIGSDVFTSECSIDPLLTDTSGNTDEFIGYWNAFVSTGAVVKYVGSLNTVFWGGALVGRADGSLVDWAFDFDAIVDAGPARINIEASQVFSSNDEIEQGTFYVAGVIRLGGDIGFRNPGAVSGTSLVWGPGSIDVVGMSRIYYNPGAGGAMATFTQAGGLQLNSQASATAYDGTTGLWTILIPITPLKLDTPIGGGGFGGTAINPGGAAYTNQAGA